MPDSVTLLVIGATTQRQGNRDMCNPTMPHPAFGGEEREAEGPPGVCDARGS